MMPKKMIGNHVIRKPMSWMSASTTGSLSAAHGLDDGRRPRRSVSVARRRARGGSGVTQSSIVDEQGVVQPRVTSRIGDGRDRTEVVEHGRAAGRERGRRPHPTSSFASRASTKRRSNGASGGSISRQSPVEHRARSDRPRRARRAPPRRLRVDARREERRPGGSAETIQAAPTPGAGADLRRPAGPRDALRARAAAHRPRPARLLEPELHGRAPRAQDERRRSIGSRPLRSALGGETGRERGLGDVELARATAPRVETRACSSCRAARGRGRAGWSGWRPIQPKTSTAAPTAPTRSDERGRRGAPGGRPGGERARPAALVSSSGPTRWPPQRSCSFVAGSPVS